ncbi:DNA sulfur modification protein DndD [Thermomonospora curvata]|uniref:Nuclease SbcCD subunit C n=1 Tax=Thermomonospora curvata (strain ATCC 19995 / DSM 43183 / JCM 3096 / KCTC 9072 / NBRC 15933 / NCIMB 10081 / Henssen B9) TaxID=471852 RepID=D1AEG2_THECD|nr:DNA sulfur modification protein DndD [Thermomonospora curvata]ACY95778.1 DNA sulfur modification protein DndD [Thermomonospora curvata DSM 43183]
MLLHNVTLKNFGAYKGEQSLELTTEPGRPIILIGGLNGCGKTTLLDAIQLALYGARARTSGRGNRSYESYLRDSINRQANPKHAHVTVEFSLAIEGRERRYKVRRSWEANGKNVREFLNVLVDGELDLVVSDNWADHIEDILPLEAASLFFFDGEKIESLADPERAAPVIESAVYSLLGVNTVEQLRTDLLALQRRQKVPDEDKQALERIQQLEREIREVDQLCADTNQKAAAARDALQRAEAHFSAVDEAFSKEGGDLYSRRAELEAEKEQAEAHLRSINETLANTLAPGPLPLLLLGPQVVALQKQVQKERTAAKNAQVIEILNERDHLLLETLKDLVPAEGLAAAEKYLAEDRQRRAKETAETRQVLNFPADSFPQLVSLDEVLRQEAKRARELVDQAQELRERLDILERQLAGVPDKTVIAALIEERDAARDQVTRHRLALAAAEEELSAARRRREQLLSERERAYKGRAQKLAKAEAAARIISYADRVRDTLEKFKTALLRRHINRLEVAVLDSFNRLMRKSELVRDLRIDTEKFTLTLIGPDDEKLAPSRLSAGERQLLAVSLLWGLARVAGNRLPSVIDTPLGRLDSRHREHLVERYFPHASHQVLLLSTDEEIDEYLLGKLKPSISHSYTLVHDDKNFTTTVEPGYWWGTGAIHVA